MKRRVIASASLGQEQRRTLRMPCCVKQPHAKGKRHLVHLCEVPRVSRFTEAGSGGRRGLGSGGGGRGLDATASVWDDEKVLEMDSGDGCTRL